MENLLPAVANIDVTSNEFRGTTLPYQQWEVKFNLQSGSNSLLIYCRILWKSSPVIHRLQWSSAVWRNVGLTEAQAVHVKELSHE